jgi:acyl-CoA synthetase (AMP-forming)/AMP-acid ligase II
MDAVPSFRSFTDIARDLANGQPERVALSFEGRETSYRDFDKRTNQVANALLAAGFSKGDRVAYLGKNRLPGPAGAFGRWCAARKALSCATSIRDTFSI